MYSSGEYIVIFQMTMRKSVGKTYGSSAIIYDTRFTEFPIELAIPIEVETDCSSDDLLSMALDKAHKGPYGKMKESSNVSNLWLKDIRKI